VQVAARFLLVAVCALAGCGGSDDEAACRDGTGGDVKVAYAATAPQGGPPPPGALDRAIRIVCDRAESADVELHVQRRGAAEVELGIDRDDRGQLDRLTARGQLVFYDWEPNVYGSPDQPLNDVDEATRQAARARPRAEDTDVPDDRGNDGGGSAVREVPRGVVVVKAERPAEAGSGLPDQYFVVEDDVELSGADIVEPEQGFDQQTQEPIVTMEFTDRGKAAFARVTKRIAGRGQRALPQPGQPPEARFQRFAIALDGQIVSLATIDFVANPDGISGDSGAQMNGIGSIEDTRALADSLRLGALPVRLEPVR
jgi:preprotein translocase subunit SecD